MTASIIVVVAVAVSVAITAAAAAAGHIDVRRVTPRRRRSSRLALPSETNPSKVGSFTISLEASHYTALALTQALNAAAIVTPNQTLGKFMSASGSIV